MLALPLSAPARPAYRPYRTRVAAIRQLSPHFLRLTLHGEALRDFGTAGLDQRIKLVIPFADGHTSDIGVDDPAQHADWYERWRELPDEARNPIRSYTVRAVRPQLGEIDVDLVAHEALPGTELGPAARWAQRVRPGDELIIVGPDAHGPDPHLGIDWQPGGARRLLLVADETAVPAACSILEALPTDARVDAIFEVPATGDILPVSSPAQAHISWLARNHIDARAQPGSLLPEAVENWAAQHPGAYRAATASTGQLMSEPDIDIERIWETHDAAAPGRSFYAWLAGEQFAIKRMRRHLVRELGIDRRVIAFMGYWRYGIADIQ